MDLKQLAEEIAKLAKASTYPEVMTVDQMKEYLQISRPTAYELIHQKKFPTFRIGNAVRIPKKILDQWIEEQTNIGG